MSTQAETRQSPESGRLDNIPLLMADGVSKTYISGTFRKSYTHALDTVTLSVPMEPPSITAIAGESGSGKTTLARTILGLVRPTAGRVLYRGVDISQMDRAAYAQFRREVQVVFQDPFESYNPFYKVDHVLQTPIRRYNLARSRSATRDLVIKALQTVGLRADETLGRYPHQLSGGQRQRVMVARAVMLEPKIIVADEPVSMVDASLRATILETLREMNERLGISILYITHDLTTAYQLAENIIIMYQGRVAEAGGVEEVINRPTHPYTQQLVDSIPHPDPDTQWGTNDKSTFTSEIVSSGCNFYDRCPSAMERCQDASPPLYRNDAQRVSRCYLHAEHEQFDLNDLREVFSN